MIRTQIEAVVRQLVTGPKFQYGTANEINLLADNSDWSNGVVMLYTLKPVKKKTTISQAVSERFSLYMEFLFKTEFDQYTSQNEVYILMANALCNEFLVKLEYYREIPLAARYFQIHVDEGMTSLPVYNKLDLNSTGVNLSLELSSMQNQGFDPASRPVGYVGT
jgi:hypothetical protein